MPSTATTRRLERQAKRARRAHIASLRSHKASGARFVLAIAAGAAPVPGATVKGLNNAGATVGFCTDPAGHSDGSVANDRPVGIPFST
jgi:hypothetical protein